LIVILSLVVIKWELGTRLSSIVFTSYKKQHSIFTIPSIPYYNGYQRGVKVTSTLFQIFQSKHAAMVHQPIEMPTTL
jgi:hypothetical protein